MSATINMDERFTGHMQKAIKDFIAVIIEEEAEEAAKRIRRRVAEKVDGLAMKMASEYDVMRAGNRIMITVKKLAGDEGVIG